MGGSERSRASVFSEGADGGGAWAKVFPARERIVARAARRPIFRIAIRGFIDGGGAGPPRALSHEENTMNRRGFLESGTETRNLCRN